MHMSDALLSPAVGATFWGMSALAVGWSARNLETESGRPLMGVLGAFVFTAQMINVAIPGTGSSGHLSGAILMAALVGPRAALAVMATVLALQALLFADGGLLALGCNVFNLGVLPLFVVFPLARGLVARRRSVGLVLACMGGAALGALGVVVETVLSGRTALPFRPFLAAMIPLHLVIGLGEGLLTAALVSALVRTRPELLLTSAPTGSRKTAVRALALSALLCAGGLTWVASSRPDALEASILRLTGHEEPEVTTTGTHQRLAQMQSHTAVMPDYTLKGHTLPGAPALAGLLGGGLTLGAVMGLAFLMRRRA